MEVAQGEIHRACRGRLCIRQARLRLRQTAQPARHPWRPTPEISNFGAGLVLLKGRDDLLLGEAALSHVSPPCTGGPAELLDQDSGLGHADVVGGLASVNT